MNSGRFDVLSIDTGVADVRVGERDDLLAVARVSQNLLVTRYSGVKNHLPDGLAGRADRAAAKHRAVRKREDGFGFEREQAELLRKARPIESASIALRRVGKRTWAARLPQHRRRIISSVKMRAADGAPWDRRARRRAVEKRHPGRLAGARDARLHGSDVRHRSMQSRWLHLTGIGFAPARCRRVQSAGFHNVGPIPAPGFARL